MASPADRLYRVTPSRANFMIVSFTSILGLITLGYVGAAIAYLIPPKGAGSRAQDLGRLSSAGIEGPSGTVAFDNGVAGPFVYDATGRGDAQGVFVVDTGGDPTQASNLPVLKQTCRHLGCPVAWTAATNTFNCPCHGSVFSKKGDRVSGPTPAGLYKHSFEVKNGTLWVKGREQG